MSRLGYDWLLNTLGLPDRPLATRSVSGTRLRSTRSADGSARNEYPPQYTPEPTLAGHLEFALKYDGVDLCALRDVFRACGPDPIEAMVAARPTGSYSRRIGFFFEFVTGRVLEAAARVGGNYVAALDPELACVAPVARRDRRWRVLDNLIGDARFCPTVRRTSALDEGVARLSQGVLQALVAAFPPELFERASSWLYLKETRSTFGIEREAAPVADRARRFLALLLAAGSGAVSSMLDEARLVACQNVIVDPRFAAVGFRTEQNYVGQQLPDFTERVHYVCPPPELVPSLMAGLATVAARTTGLSPLLSAAVVSFGFVFVHPFDDGNGRLHRFLIHDLLQRGGFVPPGVMLPVSATMLRRLAEYDAVLERYSRPLVEGLAAYTLDGEGRLTLLNPEVVEGWYRYPDLTAQAEYLVSTIARCIDEDFAPELHFLRRYDARRRAIRDVVDLPDRRLDLLMRLLHQNDGRLADRKRDLFADLSDTECRQVEAAFAHADADSA